MKLNTIKPAKGAKTARFRVARGIGSGMGKTAGRGHKGQRARKGGRGKVGFEGGQMPIQRRLPKRGFNSAIARSTAEINLSDLNKMKATEIDLAVLKSENVIRHDMLSVKLVKSGTIARAVTLKGIAATKGAREAVAAAGGSISE